MINNFFHLGWRKTNSCHWLAKIKFPLRHCFFTGLDTTISSLLLGCFRWSLWNIYFTFENPKMLQKLTRKETPFYHLTDTFRWGATWGFFPGDCPKTTDFRTFAFSKWNCLKNIIFITSAIVPAMLVYVLIGSKGQ